MDDPLTKAQHYRHQALHMRELAEKDDNPQTREALIQLAENYERLYRKFVDIAATGRDAEEST